MKTLTKENLNRLIASRIEDFKKAHNAISSYNSEQQTMGDYNGRQILELIQNADDAGAKNIFIQLNPEKNELVFFNDGVPFDFEGIESIMIANLSSKITSSYIGNKGLGFRSILNWANSIAIYSAGLKIEFSREVLKEYLDNELSCLDLEDIRDSRNLSSECIPLPVLGLPRVSKQGYDGCDDNKGCALQIIYNKDKEADIINQIKAIDDRTLLFLQHIEKVTVNNSQDANADTSITVDKDVWDIRTKDDVLEDRYQDKNKKEKKKYSVKIAIPQSGLLEEPSPLYNYLPSKERVHLPFLLHATVELNSSRNHVNESDVNDHILRKAAELIRDVAQEQLNNTQNQSDWTAYRMMTPAKPEKEYGSLKALYATLDNLKKDMAIYPTVDKQYAKANEYCYYNDDISDFWYGFEVKGTFSKMLRPVDGGLAMAQKPMANFTNAIADVSKLLKEDCEKRVRLIRHLYSCKNICFNGLTKVPLLIDNRNNIIEGEAYIQDNGDETLTQNLPDWVEFSVVHNDFVKKLTDEFQTEIEATKQQKKQEGTQSVSEIRCLVSLLDFINIRYFDKTGIANKVISKANDKLEEDETDKQKLIVEMLNFLYNLGSDSELKYIRLLDEKGEVKKANDLMLPTELNKQVFEGTDTQYVLCLDGWKEKNVLTELDEIHFNEFMKKLGVNRVLGEKKFSEVFYSAGYNNYLECHHIFSTAIGKKQNDLYKGSESVVIHVIRDSIVEKLKRISLQNVLQFVSSDEELLRYLKGSIQLWFFYNRNWKDIWTPYNYVRFQLSSLPSVKWKVFGTDLILDDSVDIDSLGSNGRNAIDCIRTDFSFENRKEICKFLNDSPSLFPNGKGIRKLYKIVIDSLADDGRNLTDEIQLFASDVNGNKSFHPSTEVFYSDNTCLPKKVIEKTNMFRLDYPSRQGVDKISKIFGLRSLDNLDFIIENKQDSCLSKDFNLFFRKLKPYLLLYAIQNASKQSPKKAYAGDIKNCCICLVSQCEYSINGSKMRLDPGEFVNVGNEFYLNVDGLSSISEMKSSTTYCNAITEILGMVFKLETKNEHFIHVFQGFDFMKKYIDESREDEIAECFRLLGISPEEHVFWTKYGKLKGLALDFESTDFYSQLHSFDEQAVKMVDFSNWNNKGSIDFLKKVLGELEPCDQTKLLEIVDLSAWHRTCFESAKKNYWKAFVHKLWNLLNEQCDKRPMYFSLQRDYDCLEFKADGWAHELKDNADYLACLNRKVRDLFGQKDLETIDVDLGKESPEEHDNLYPELVKSIQEEKDMEDKRWWLYFEGNEDRIKDYKKTLAKGEETTDETSVENADDEVVGEIITTSVVSAMPSGHSGKGRRQITGTHKTKTDRAKAKAGEEAEKKVDCYLRKLENKECGRFKYCRWVSKTDDAAGYDFTYFVDGQLRYLEAKVNSNNSFILSANEYKAVTENVDIYDIALVEGNKVTIIQSFFKGYPPLNPKDYEVNFSLQS